MSKYTITGFILCTKYSWEEKPRIEFSMFKPSGTSHSIVVRPHSFEIDVPDDFDPRPSQVAALQEQKRTVQAEFAKRVTEIERQISQLLCIEA